MVLNASEKTPPADKLHVTTDQNRNSKAHEWLIKVDIKMLQLHVIEEQ